MSYKKTMKGVKYLVQNELDMACEINGERFNSNHEAYAVIKEEADELYEQNNMIHFSIGDLWNSVKRNESIGADLEDIEEYALKAACEAIQVAAMARKAMR